MGCKLILAFINRPLSQDGQPFINGLSQDALIVRSPSIDFLSSPSLDSLDFQVQLYYKHMTLVRLSEVFQGSGREGDENRRKEKPYYLFFTFLSFIFSFFIRFSEKNVAVLPGSKK